ncbi:hypothetical protein CRM22_001742 [Opisthorchis felineus]|uniref:Uncharacterized protein n=1 Tax=Opisthorchis felineus TaxID=147828 RepID=A0A4S2M969_OPIFE|nr:hypothetical protein CRM22_001742 [Opisthorchis felineus]
MLATLFGLRIHASSDHIDDQFGEYNYSVSKILTKTSHKKNARKELYDNWYWNYYGAHANCIHMCEFYLYGAYGQSQPTTS